MENRDTFILKEYKYIWKTKKGGLCVKYITDTDGAHEEFMKALRESEDVVSAVREYVSEINMAYFGYTKEVKKEEKESEQNEKV